MLGFKGFSAFVCHKSTTICGLVLMFIAFYFNEVLFVGGGWGLFYFDFGLIL